MLLHRLVYFRTSVTFILRNFAERSIHFAKMDGVLALMGGVKFTIKRL